MGAKFIGTCPSQFGSGRRRGRGLCLARTSQLHLHHDHVDQRRHRWTPRLDHKMRRFPVQRVSNLEQLAYALQGIFHLKQGAISVIAKPPEHFFWRGFQVENRTPCVQSFPVFRAQYRAATRRHHGRRALGQVIQHSCFKVAKAGLTLALEELTDRASQPLFDDMVGIKKRKGDATRQLASHR